MQTFSRTLVAVLTSLATFLFAASIAATSFAQQADSAKPATPKKQTAVPSPEKSTESAAKPEAPEQKPAPRESSGDRDVREG